MNWLSRYCKSSLGRKYLMAVTGLLLCGFLVSHLAGNFLLLISQEAFNTYAHTLTSNPLIYGAEAVLATLFLCHISLGLKLAVENRMARGEQRYAVKRSTGRGETFASKTMVYTGMWTLVFLIIHLINFKVAGIINGQKVVHNGIEIVDIYGLVMEHFQSAGWTAYYVLSMTLLGVHLSHGFASAFQSLGLHHPKYNPIIKVVGTIYALSMAVGFSAVAIFCHLKGAGL